MNGALWLLLALSLRGRITRFTRQLRQPKYLVGLVVGACWMLLWVGRSLDGRSLAFSGARIDERIHEVVPLGRLALAIGVAGWFSLAWLLPRVSSVLPLREAELHVLLPAPIPRRRLIQFALQKGQVSILISAFVLSLVVLGGGGLARTLSRFVSWWVFLTLWDLHGRWRALTLSGLRGLAPRAAWRRRVLIYGVLAIYWAALGTALRPLAAASVAALFDPSRDLEALLVTARGATDAGALPWLLSPFLLMSGPLFAEGLAGYALSFAAAFVLLALLHEVVVRSRTSFEEPALEYAVREATRRSPVRRYGRLSERARLRVPYALAGTGPVEVAILWKNLLQIARVPLAVMALLGAVVVLALAVLAAFGFLPLAVVVAGFGVGLAAVSPFVAGLGLRNDLRAELRQAEMVRPWPVPAHRFVLAQMIAPTLIGVALGWFGLGLVAAARVGTLFSVPGSTLGSWDVADTTMVLVGLGLAPVLAGVTGLLVALGNVAALLFPAWSGLGVRGAGGLAAIGQQMLFGFALFVCLALGLLPGAALVGLAVLVQWGLGVGLVPAAYPVWGLLLTAPLVLEIALLVRAGAGLWEQFDPAQEILETP